MKNNVLAAIAALLLMHAVSAEQVLSVELDVYKNDSVVLHQMTVEEGYSTKYVSPGDYRLQITDASGKNLSDTVVGLSFMVWSDPPQEMDPSALSLRISYTKDMRILKLYRSDKLLFTSDINVCNDDGACEMGFETHLSCPGDCPQGSRDGICTPEKDGVCDPDCAQGADPDCRAGTGTTVSETTTTKPPGKEADAGLLGYLPYLVILIVLAALVLFVLRRRSEE